MNKRLVSIITLSVLFFLFSGGLRAEYLDFEMTLHGTIAEPASCQITGPSIIHVNFGDELLNSKIVHMDYQKDFTVPISCKGSPVGVKMQFYGDTFDAFTLRTSKANLGIRLLRGNTVEKFNSWLDIDYKKPVTFTAMPVSNGSGTISGGKFNAAVTLAILLP